MLRGMVTAVNANPTILLRRIIYRCPDHHIPLRTSPRKKKKENDGKH
jgi:hypothetical protein